MKMANSLFIKCCREVPNPLGHCHVDGRGSLHRVLRRGVHCAATQCVCSDRSGQAKTGCHSPVTSISLVDTAMS